MSLAELSSFLLGIIGGASSIVLMVVGLLWTGLSHVGVNGAEAMPLSTEKISEVEVLESRSNPMLGGASSPGYMSLKKELDDLKIVVAALQQTRKKA